MDFSKGMSILERSDDILTEIMLRLPSKSIFKFTCVTTRWNNVINDRFFGKLYLERTKRSLTCSYPHGKLLGLLQTSDEYGPYMLSRFANPTNNFMPVHGEEYVPDAPCGGDVYPVEYGYFITCTKDGLFLCGRIPHTYYVGNPITGQWETPPPTPYRNSMKHVSVGLSSNEEDDSFGGKIINFRVIVLTDCYYVYGDGIGTDTRGVKVIPIDTYSSKTRKWRRSSLISEIPVNIKDGQAPIFSGGFFHWFTVDMENFVAYDPCSLDEEDEQEKYNKKHVVQVIESPRSLGNQIIWRSDNGQTIWFGNSGFHNGIEVFRKCYDDDDWTCISREELDTMKKDIIGITQKDVENEVAKSGVKIESMFTHRDQVWMIAFIPWDPKLILIRHWDRIYIYDCIRKKLDEVILDGERYVTDHSWVWYPYFHTLSSSPYNLKGDYKH